jgi:hypothetical protein
MFSLLMRTNRPCQATTVSTISATMLRFSPDPAAQYRSLLRSTRSIGFECLQKAKQERQKNAMPLTEMLRRSRTVESNIAWMFPISPITNIAVSQAIDAQVTVDAAATSQHHFVYAGTFHLRPCYCVVYFSGRTCTPKISIDKILANGSTHLSGKLHLRFVLLRHHFICALVPVTPTVLYAERDRMSLTDRT